MFNQTHKISQNNTAVLTITILNTKDTIIRVIMGLVKQRQNLYIYLTKVIKSLKTIISIIIATFSNTKDTIIRVIMGLVKQ